MRVEPLYTRGSLVEEFIDLSEVYLSARSLVNRRKVKPTHEETIQEEIDKMIDELQIEDEARELRTEEEYMKALLDIFEASYGIFKDTFYMEAHTLRECTYMTAKRVNENHERQGLEPVKPYIAFTTGAYEHILRPYVKDQLKIRRFKWHFLQEVMYSAFETGDNDLYRNIFMMHNIKMLSSMEGQWIDRESSLEILNRIEEEYADITQNKDTVIWTPELFKQALLSGSKPKKKRRWGIWGN